MEIMARGRNQRLITVSSLFTVIWAVTAIIFFVQAQAAYSDETTVLPPYSITIPSNANVQIGPVRFQDVINGLAASVQRKRSDLAGIHPNLGTALFSAQSDVRVLGAAGYVCTDRTGQSKSRSLLIVAYGLFGGGD